MKHRGTEHTEKTSPNLRVLRASVFPISALVFVYVARWIDAQSALIVRWWCEPNSNVKSLADSKRTEQSSVHGEHSESRDSLEDYE